MTNAGSPGGNPFVAGGSRPLSAGLAAASGNFPVAAVELLAGPAIAGLFDAFGLAGDVELPPSVVFAGTTGVDPIADRIRIETNLRGGIPAPPVDTSRPFMAPRLPPAGRIAVAQAIARSSLGAGAGLLGGRSILGGLTGASGLVARLLGRGVATTPPPATPDAPTEPDVIANPGFVFRDCPGGGQFLPPGAPCGPPTVTFDQGGNPVSIIPAGLTQGAGDILSAGSGGISGGISDIIGSLGGGSGIASLIGAFGGGGGGGGGNTAALGILASILGSRGPAGGFVAPSPVVTLPGMTMPGVGGQLPPGATPVGFADDAVGFALELLGRSQLRPGMPQAVPCPTPMVASGPRPATTIVLKDENDQDVHYRKKGRPLLYADDFAACRRVERVARRGAKACGLNRGRRRPC